MNRKRNERPSRTLRIAGLMTVLFLCLIVVAVYRASVSHGVRGSQMGVASLPPLSVTQPLPSEPRAPATSPTPSFTPSSGTTALLPFSSSTPVSKPSSASKRFESLAVTGEAHPDRHTDFERDFGAAIAAGSDFARRSSAPGTHHYLKFSSGLATYRVWIDGEQSPSITRICDGCEVELAHDPAWYVVVSSTGKRWCLPEDSAGCVATLRVAIEPGGVIVPSGYYATTATRPARIRSDDVVCNFQNNLFMLVPLGGFRPSGCVVTP